MNAIHSRTGASSCSLPTRSLAPFAGAVEELAVVPDIELAFAAATRLPHCVFFDSARQQDELGRYSFLAADPFDFVALGVDEAISAAAAGEGASKIWQRACSRLQRRQSLDCRRFKEDWRAFRL